MRFTSFLLALGCVLGHQEEEATIDCKSSTADITSGDGVTNDYCIAECEKACADVANSVDLDACLSTSSLRGCKFNVVTKFVVHGDACFNHEKQTAVAHIDSSELMPLSGGDRVSKAMLNLSVSNGDSLKDCNKAATFGINTQPYTEQCLADDSFSNNSAYELVGDTVSVNLLDVVNGVLGSDQHLNVGVKFNDSCKVVGVMKSASITFSLSYQAGFLDKAKCWDIQGCERCKAQGCHWCDWNSVVGHLLPEWLPDWQWVEEARADDQGQCGMNHALCTVSGGKYDVCAASARWIFSLAALCLALVLVL